MIRQLGLCAVVTAWLASAQQPPISNADLRQASAANGLEQALKSSVGSAGGPLWIGYAVPAIPNGGNNSCCWNDGGRGCGLEGIRPIEASTAAPTPVRLEGPSHVVILMRYEQGAGEKVRVFSPDCPLDAGGLPFYWLSGVKPSESVAMLMAWFKRAQENRVGNKGPDSAVHAIAMHAGPEAETALMTLAAPAQAESTRKSALFWLANSRGRQGYDVVSKVAREDGSDKVREHAIFALTLSRQPEAIPALIQIAKEDKAPRVRKQAMFWLGQSRDRRAIEFFEQVLGR
jgi:hypothetical protein